MAIGVSKKTFRVDLGDVDVTISGNTEVADPDIQDALDEKLNIIDTASVWASQIDSAIDVTPDDSDLFGVVEDNLAVPTARKFSFASLKSFLKTYFDTLYGGLADLANHIDNTSNPHSVTKTQVGLGNVQDLDTTTTVNITDSLNKRFVTDSDVTKLGNLSGTNTGDETQSSIQTKLGTASSSTSGYLTSTDWNTFNNKQNSLGFTPLNKAGDSISSSDGSGFIGFISQSVTPLTPVSGFRLYANNSNSLSWIGQNGFTRTFDGTGNTANRIYSLPDNSGTIALTSNFIPGGNNTETQFNNNGSFGSSSKFVRVTNDLIGIGKSNPTAQLDVLNSNASQFIFRAVGTTNQSVQISDSGFLGLGVTTNPLWRIHTFGVDALSSGILQNRNSDDLFGCYHIHNKLRSNGQPNNGDFSGGPTFSYKKTGDGGYTIYSALWGYIENPNSQSGGIGFITTTDGGIPDATYFRGYLHSSGNWNFASGNTVNNTSKVFIEPSNGTDNALKIKSSSAQSADLMQFINSSSVKQFYIDNAYKLWGIDAEFSGEVKGNIYPQWDTTIYTSSPTINFASNNKNYWLNFSTNQSLTLPSNSTLTKNIQFNLHFRSISTGTLTISSSATIQGNTSFSSGTVYILFDTINNTWLIRP